MWCVLCVQVLEVVVCRVKKPLTGERGSQAREHSVFCIYLIFVLNRMPIAGDKLPAFLRRIVPGERGGVLCSYHLFKHTMDYHPIYICLSHACSSTVRCSFLRSASAELTEMPPTVPSHHP